MPDVKLFRGTRALHGHREQLPECYAVRLPEGLRRVG